MPIVFPVRVRGSNKPVEADWSIDWTHPIFRHCIAMLDMRHRVPQVYTRSIKKFDESVTRTGSYAQGGYRVAGATNSIWQVTTAFDWDTMPGISQGAFFVGKINQLSTSFDNAFLFGVESSGGGIRLMQNGTGNIAGRLHNNFGVYTTTASVGFSNGDTVTVFGMQTDIVTPLGNFVHVRNLSNGVVATATRADAFNFSGAAPHGFFVGDLTSSSSVDVIGYFALAFDKTLALKVAQDFCKNPWQIFYKEYMMMLPVAGGPTLITASVVGGSTLSVQRQINLDPSVSSTASITTQQLVNLNVGAAVTGTGTVTVDVQSVIQETASVTGLSTVTVSRLIQLGASLSGSSTITAQKLVSLNTSIVGAAVLTVVDNTIIVVSAAATGIAVVTVPVVNFIAGTGVAAKQKILKLAIRLVRRLGL